MKPVSRLVALLILVMLLAIPLYSQGVTYISPRFDSLNVRSGPGLEHGVIVEIYGLTQYPVVDRSFTGNWILIDLGYTQGWVHQAYVIESNYSYAMPTTTNPGQGGGAIYYESGGAVITNPGQGGGFVAPTTTYVQPTYIAPTYVQPSVVVGTTNLGQGGGFVDPALTVETTTNMGVANTVGSWVGLNIRRGPDHTYGVLAIMPQGDRAIPLGRNARGTWYYVEYNGVRGWVTHELVSVPPNINVPALPVVSNE